jgi:hypothetical protein
MPSALNPTRVSRSAAATDAGAAAPAQGRPVATVVTAVLQDSVAVAAVLPAGRPSAAELALSGAATAQTQVSTLCCACLHTPIARSLNARTSCPEARAFSLRAGGRRLTPSIRIDGVGRFFLLTSLIIH